MSGTPTQPRKTERELFLEALEHPTPEARSAFLEAACAGDSALRESVETLLQHHKEDRFLESPSLDRDAMAGSKEGPSGTAILGAIGERAGDRIGSYKLLQQIGEGGVGVVFMAEQEAPVRRRVALKVLKPGMDTKSVIARFESERQALALMDHPNIAKVLDAGSTVSGRPYFVMELVRGVHVTEYCTQSRMSTRERLVLFIQICQAIQHAHQKGIIHRDIKPSNILVTLHDGVPVPKVIDFGIAKATEQRLTDKTLFTEFQSFIGTPAYISPEQAEMSGLDIDTRTDIYSLGVLLYELLVGQTPFDAGELCSSGLDGMRRTIREKEPAAPSTRLRMLSEAERTTTAQRQRSEPARLRSVLRGDVDWIVLKALEKDRARRYATANDLALDIRRYLDNEPILARPPSTAYRFRKLVRRNKLVFVGAGAFAAALVLGLVLATWQFIEKSVAYSRAVKAEQEEARLRQEAEGARQLAETQALVAQGQAYAADMNLAQQALAANNLGRAQELLHRHRPGAGTGIGQPSTATDPTFQAQLPADLRGWEWRYLWQQCQSDALFTLCQLSNEVTALSVSHDGNWVAIGEYGGRGLSIWDLRARQEIARFGGGESGEVFAFSPAAPILAISIKESPGRPGPDKRQHQVRFWDVMTRRFVGELPLPSSCRALFYSKDGTKLLTAIGDSDFSVWNIATGTQLANVVVPRPKEQDGRSPLGDCLAVNQDFSLAAQAITGGQLRVVDLVTGEELWTAAAADEFVTALAFSPDGTRLASGAGFVESTVRLWDVASGRELARLEGHRTYVRALEFWPDGGTLASASGDQTIHLWDVGSLESLPSGKTSAGNVVGSPKGDVPRRPKPFRVAELHPHLTLRGHRLEVWSLALGPDRTTLVSGSKDGSVCVWDTATLRRDRAHVTLPEPVRAWTFAQDGQAILTLNDQGRVASWQGADFQHGQTLLELGTNAFTACFSTHGRFIATSSPGGAIQVWDLQQGDLLRELDTGEGSHWLVALFEDPHHVATQNRRDGMIRVWDLETGAMLQSWGTGTAGRMGKSAFSPNGQWQVMLGAAGRGRLRQLANGEETDLDLPLEQVSGVAFSPDARWLAAVSVLGTGLLWDLSTTRTAATLQGFLQGTHSVAFSPDGRRLAIGSNGNEAIKIWDVHNAQELITLKGQGSMFNSVAFSPDGQLLASSNSRGILHVWRAPSLREITRLEQKKF